jgi:hypothetical protein
VHVISSAQEITRNIDGYTLSPPGGCPAPSWIESRQPELDRVVSGLYSEDRLSGHYNKGQKPLFGSVSNGFARMKEFSDFVFNSEVCSDKATIILGGHSLWFREFFKNFQGKTETVQLRNSDKQITFCSAKFKVKSHDKKLYVIALKYGDESEYADED